MEVFKHIPIYKSLINKYKADILNHKYVPGIQIDSINKIISKHKVSRETAKIVLKHLAKEGLIVQVPGKGSFVSETKSVVKKWGFILPMYSSNMEQLINQLTSLAESKGMKLEYYLHYNNPEEEMRLVSSLIKKGYNSLFIAPNYNEALTAKYYSRLVPEKTKIFLVDYTMAGSSFSYVIQSYDLGVKRVVEYMAKQSKGNFLFLRDSAWRGLNLVAESMLETLKEYGEKIYERNVFILKHHKQVTKDYINRNSISGILCCNDTDAIKIYSKLQSWDYKMPSEFSLVNYGNTELLELVEPGITTVNCSYNEMVDKIDLLYNTHKAYSTKEQHIILPKLIIRNT